MLGLAEVDVKRLKPWQLEEHYIGRVPCARYMYCRGFMAGKVRHHRSCFIHILLPCDAPCGCGTGHDDALHCQVLEARFRCSHGQGCLVSLLGTRRPGRRFGIFRDTTHSRPMQRSACRQHCSSPRVISAAMRDREGCNTCISCQLILLSGVGRWPKPA